MGGIPRFPHCRRTCVTLIGHRCFAGTPYVDLHNRNCVTQHVSTVSTVDVTCFPEQKVPFLQESSKDMLKAENTKIIVFILYYFSGCDLQNCS